MKEIQYYCFTTEYDGEKMEWFINYATKEIKKEPPFEDCTVIGNEGELPIKDIEDNIFILCKPTDNNQWGIWVKSIADKFRDMGMEKQDIKNKLVEILFNGVSKYKNGIIEDCDTDQDLITQKKHKFYFGVQLEDLL